ncbi:hypothetical protein [Nostoc sp. PCC 7107]|uniref:hypothetical protein n=1 Tax=Nostoc sp. PCC 7107 TaxID=317936 RepID=UPI00029F02A4|nr:hypothetical protein [Nostoc sp. PCC 7107]AFY43457.1 uncharacterized protein C20orf194 [Nostoc sp. PCC 7107]
MPILDFRLPILDFFGSHFIPSGQNESKIQNLKSSTPVLLWLESIQNPTSKIKNCLAKVVIPN